MTNLHLDFTQRFKLTNLLAVQEGPLGKTASYYRVMEAVRFTDAEEQKIVKTYPGINHVQWNPPADAEEGWGDLVVDIETEDGVQLVDLIKTCPQMRTVDHVWAGPLLKQLDGATPILVKRKKGA